jgi:riboflavin transporter FmnP
MKTHYISAGAIFGTMAVVVRILGIKLPFPPIPYLTFEFAEIPIILGFLFYGPAVGLVSVFSYWIILNVVGSFVPIGPAMAFAASLSTICGIWVGLKAAGRLGFSKDLAITLGFIIGSTFRIIVMSFFNYIVLCVLMPSFFDFASKSLSTFLGVSFSSQVYALTLIFIFTAIFNIIQVAIIFVPSLPIVKLVESRAGLYLKAGSWLTNVLKKEK